MKTSYLFTSLGFAAVTLATWYFFFKIFRKSLHATPFPEERRKRLFRNTLLAVVGWMMVVSGLSLSGVLSDFSALPPRFTIVLLVPLITVILVVRTETVKVILQHTDPAAIVVLQSFRIAVEVLLWLLFVQNLAPVQMTFEGRNLDVLSGLTALPVAWLASRKQLSSFWLAAWNLACLGLLINIVATALLSMPTPLRVFMNEPSSVIVTRFPVVWLPALLVPMAYGLQFLSLRQVLAGKKRGAPLGA
ncbi:hypothetical protein [Chryseolinea soli]|uniref:Uncharacterized protein n=1 Tax=Chryseolinea soli TaxID=2321403 RepID=A0A385SVI3_9BACT|nr:hypothetical protein [Chryseolinea soli]AYB34556.1 hypothetical protein D4L85_30000 [Chryseolinea soli]